MLEFMEPACTKCQVAGSHGKEGSWVIWNEILARCFALCLCLAFLLDATVIYKVSRKSMMKICS